VEGVGNEAPERSGRELARLRTARGLSARQLAELAGVSHSSVCRAEDGHHVRREIVAALAKVLGPAVYDDVPVWPPLPVGDGLLEVARRETGESISDAATRAGVSRDVLRRAERGQGVHPANAKRIADAFGLAVDDVLPIPTPKKAPTRKAA